MQTQNQKGKYMLEFVKYKTNATFKTLKGKWHARIKHSETEDIASIARHIRNHNSPLSESVIKSVIEDFTNCMVEQLLEGKNVRIENLGIFSITAKSDGADSPDEISASSLKDFQLNVKGIGKLSKAELKESVKLQEAPTYEKQ